MGFSIGMNRLYTVSTVKHLAGGGKWLKVKVWALHRGGSHVVDSSRIPGGSLATPTRASGDGRIDLYGGSVFPQATHQEL